MQPVRDIAPRLFVYSRRGARLLERIAADRPSLSLSSVLAELSGDRPTGIPAVLVDKLALALHRLIDEEREARGPVGARDDDIAVAPGKGIPPLPGELAPLLTRVDKLERQLRGPGPQSGLVARGKRARVTLEADPPAFFYTEGEGAFPAGMALPILEAEPRFVPVRGALLPVDAQLYALERIKDVILEPIADEGERLLQLCRPRVGALLQALDDLSAVIGDERPSVAWVVKSGRVLSVRPVVYGGTALTATSKKDILRTIAALPFATDIDVRIARRISEQGDALDVAMADLLARHGRVELVDGRRVTVIRETLGIVVDDERKLALRVGGFAVQAGEVAEEGGAVVVDGDEARIIVSSLGSRERALARAVADLGGAVPPEALRDVVERLRRLGGEVQVHLSPDLRGRFVEPVLGLVLRVAWLEGGGARMSLVVQPLPAGPVFLPGEGPREVFGSDARGPIWTQRRLAEEKSAADGLLARFVTHDEQLDGPWRILVQRRPDALAALAIAAEEEHVSVAYASDPIRVRRASAQELRVRLTDGADWLGLQGGLELEEGRRVALAPLLQALREGRRYVVVDNDEVISLGQELSDRLSFISMISHSTDSKDSKGQIRVARSAVPLLDEHAAGSGLVIEGFDARRASLDAAHLVTGDAPEGLRAELRSYQQDGLRFLRRLVAWGAGGVLADDMGLGKTLMTIALLLDRAVIGPAVVALPTSLGFNWQAEISRFAPSLRSHVYGESLPGQRAGLLQRLGTGDVLLVSYGLVQRDSGLLAERRFATLILDEAQAVKNANAARSQAVRALQADVRIALTGTPLENHTGELWSIFEAVSPGFFGTWPQFKARFAQPIEKDQDPERRRLLARTIRPFLLRRKKADVLQELPAKIEVDQVLEPSAAERQAYEDLRAALLLDLEGDVDAVAVPAGERRMQVLAAITRLRLCACHPGLAFGDHVSEGIESGTKQLALTALIDELREAGHRALVFSQFVRHLTLARQALERTGARILMLTGATPAAQRAELVERFQRGDADVFLISLKAGGTGLNLTRASYVIHLDPWWNPAVEDQATDRSHRIGQEETVTVVRLLIRGTIEEMILGLHKKKRALVDGVLAGADAADRLSADELIDLVRHSRRYFGANDGGQEIAGQDGRDEEFPSR